MNILLLAGMVAVAGGMGAVAVGVGRNLMAARVGGNTVEAILEDGAPGYQAEFVQPLFVRLSGPVWGTFETAVRTVTPSMWIERLGRNAKLAGLGRWGIEGVLALKGVFALAGGVLMALLAIGFDSGMVLWAVVGGLGGFFGPDIWIARRAEARQNEIRRALPETLDLLAISVGAGMGLEGAIELVSHRLPGALGEEFHRLLQELQLGASRREALHHLRDRTEVSELSTFALALAQADALGSPLAEVLRVQAGEMRMLRRQRAREHAAKVPVKLLFPLLVGIFPALGIVVVGPAVISIARAFG